MANSRRSSTGPKTPTNNNNNNINETGRTLPGRNFLFGFVVMAAIFLDFETSAVSSYHRPSDTNYDAERVLRDNVEEIGKMQQYQLEKQWNEYSRRVNENSTIENNSASSTSGPEEIVIEEDTTGMARPENNTIEKESLTGSTVAFNISAEEITVEADEEVPGSNATTSLTTTNSTKKNETHKVGIVNGTKPSVATEEEITIQTSDECYPHNSQRWLKGKRYSNADTNLTNDFVYQQILMQSPLAPDAFYHASSQTICHAQSQFRNPSGEWDLQNEQLLNQWELRLIYMAIHRYHHAPASMEALARAQCPQSSLSTSIPRMDYECTGTKFFIVNLNPIGLGAALRLGAAAALLVGMAADRVVIFANNVNGTKADFLERSWPMASCHRQDMQCFYMPTTPCAVLEKDIRQAIVLPEIDARDLRRGGTLTRPEYVNQTVLIYEGKPAFARKFGIHAKIRFKLYDLAMQLIDSIRGGPPEQVEFLHAAAARIKLDDDIGHENETKTQYMSKYSKSSHAALMYLMRPNPFYQQKSDELVSSSLPKDAPIDLSLTIGLPIRGSDKCRSESICYTFDRYMALMTRMWQNELQSPELKKGTIVMTTEDETIFTARKAYESNESFPLQFLVNQNDLRQGSGLPRLFQDKGDAVMLASIVSLKMQLLTRHTVGNCCSNFHLLLFDLLNSGCGALSDGEPMCLQDDPDPQFRICCGWSQTEECDEIRNAAAAERREDEAEKEAQEKNQTGVVTQSSSSSNGNEANNTITNVEGGIETSRLSNKSIAKHSSKGDSITTTGATKDAPTNKTASDAVISNTTAAV